MRWMREQCINPQVLDGFSIEEEWNFEYRTEIMSVYEAAYMRD